MTQILLHSMFNLLWNDGCLDVEILKDTHVAQRQFHYERILKTPSLCVLHFL